MHITMFEGFTKKLFAIGGRCFILGLALATFSGCFEAKTPPPALSSYGIQTAQSSCKYTDRVTYYLNVNLEADFSVANVWANHMVIESNCSGLPAGSTNTDVIDSISRTDGTLKFTDSGYYQTAHVSGSNISIVEQSGCDSGVSIQGKLRNSYLEFTDEQIVLIFDWTLTQTNCRTDPGNLAGTPVEPGPIASPSPISSSSPNPSPTPTPTFSPSPSPSLSPLPMHPESNPSRNMIFFNSQVGDYIGRGLTQTFEPGGSDTFTASRNYDNGVSLSYSSSAIWWHLDFAAPNNEILTAGTTYENAQRFPFQAADRAGISVGGDGRGCNTISGKFTVLEVTYGAGNSVDSFWAEFEQHCEGGVPALFGSVRFNAGPPLP